MLDALLERQELETVAQDLLGVLAFTGQDRMIEAATPIPWRVGMTLMADDDQAIRLLALTLALDAVLQTPDALLAAVRDLSVRLATVAPRLEFHVPTVPRPRGTTEEAPR
jgi:hypothetical protein